MKNLFYTALMWLFCLILVLFTYLALQSSVTESFSILINRIIAACVALAVFLCVIDFKGLFSSGLCKAVLLWSVWIVFSSLFVSGGVTTMIKMLFWTAAFFTAYTLLRKAPSRIQIPSATFAVIAVLGSVYTYLAREISEMALLLNTMGQGMDEFYETALNIVFYPLLTIPWILTLKKGMLRNILLAVVMLSIVVSVKRSALLACAAIMTFYLLFYNRYTTYRSKRIKRILIPLLLVGSVYIVTERYMSDTGDFIIERLQNMQEDKGSGRLHIYDQVLERLSLNQAEEWIFGHGTNSVIQNIAMHKSAHNDFLEVLFDYGIIGLAIYLCLHALLISRLWRLYRNGSQYFVSYLASYIIFLFMSMISHLIIYSTYFIFLAAYWGALEALMVYDRRCDDGASRLLAPYEEAETPETETDE